MNESSFEYRRANSKSTTDRLYQINLARVVRKPYAKPAHLSQSQEYKKMLRRSRPKNEEEKAPEIVLNFSKQKSTKTEEMPEISKAPKTVLLNANFMATLVTPKLRDTALASSPAFKFQSLDFITPKHWVGSADEGFDRQAETRPALQA